MLLQSGEDGGQGHWGGLGVLRVSSCLSGLLGRQGLFQHVVALCSDQWGVWGLFVNTCFPFLACVCLVCLISQIESLNSVRRSIQYL